MKTEIVQRKEERKHCPEVARTGHTSRKWRAALWHAYCFTQGVSNLLGMYLYPRSISMFHGRTVNTEIVRTSITNKGQLITTVNKVPRESPCSAVNCDSTPECLRTTLHLDLKDVLIQPFWVSFLSSSHQQLILGDAALRKKIKANPKHKRTTILRKRQ